MSTAPEAASPGPQTLSVRVTDIRMPFFSMVVFMVKWAVASVPALLMLIVLAVLFWMGTVALFGYLGSLPRRTESPSTATMKEPESKGRGTSASAQQEAMRKATSVTVVSLTSHEGSLMDYATVNFRYQNTSNKDIRAFEGSVSFHDVLGNEIASDTITVLTPVKAGQQGTMVEKLPFVGPFSGLKGKRLDDLKTDWQPTKILFVDGTSISPGSAPQ